MMESKVPVSEEKIPRALFNYMSEIYANEKTLEEWLSWPSDIFAFTSIIWSIHDHLSNSSTKNMNNISENELIVRFENAYDIATKPYQVFKTKH
jgi:hypothetical protein